MNERTRLLVAAHSPHRGGAEYCLDTTLRHLDRERFEAIVLFPDDGPMTESAREMGYEVLITPMVHWMYFRRDWWFWKNLAGRMGPNLYRLRRLLSQRQVDLVYTNTVAIFESAWAAHFSGVPHVWHIHEVLSDDRPPDALLKIRTIKRLVRRWSDRVVFESQAARRAFEGEKPLAEARVVYNSVRLDAPPLGTAEAARRQFELAPDETAVGFVGQLIDRKNPLLLLRAVERLRDLPGVVCLFAGDGPLAEQLASEIRSRGLERSCRMVGFQADVRPLLEAIDILVLPSREESFGLVLVEAGQYCKPAIACRCEGPGEIIADGETGYLVDQDDPAALAERLRDLLESAPTRRAMGKAAANRVAELFCPVLNTRRLEAVFEELVRPRDQRRGKPALATAGAEVGP